MEYLHDGQAGVEANEVGQLQGTHGDVGAILHDGVNRVAVTNTRVETDNGLVDIWHENPVGEETGRIGRDRGDLAQPLAESNGGVQGCLARLEPADDLDTLLNRDGVHEMSGDYSRAIGHVGWVQGGSGSDAGDGDGGRISSQNGMLGAYLCQFGEDIKLQVGNLWNGLDDEVDIAKRVKGCCRSEESTSGVCLLLCDALLCYILGEQFL